ncbi:MAG: tryptophan synthase subunit alpha [Bacteroidetes bacterium]|nr:MAG: tryptophan synthase subunit alpha [Bacteroidota bacterium]TAG85649.1 MAG: tryptophan synthase subunit alpha [Bacteroidota bacterium]
MKIQNNLTKYLQNNSQNLLTIYFTAGFPNLDDTSIILEALIKNQADIIEIGMPFSDPIADGEVIQQTNQIALKNGMSIEKLFEQLEKTPIKTNKPILLMGYLNPVWQFGIENFCQKAAKLGIDGLILPDMPLEEYENEYQNIFEKYNLSAVFLITPQTTTERIKKIDQLSNGFIYAVSQSSTTGKTSSITTEQTDYFQKIKNMELKNPFLIGFGIKDKQDFQKVCQYAAGGIIGSAFLKHLQENKTNLAADIAVFLDKYK